MRSVLSIGGLVASLFGIGLTLHAQAPAAPTPASTPQIVENDYVRVAHSLEAVGHKSRPHGHERAKISIFLDAGEQTILTLQPEERRDARRVTPGHVIYDGPAVQHVSLNTSTTDLHIIQVEFKKPADGTASVHRADDPVAVAPSQFSVLVDNPQVRVLRWRLRPGEETPAFRSAARTAIVRLTPEVLDVTPAGGTARRQTAARHDASWSADESVQRVRNAGSEPFEAIVAEVKTR